MKTAPAMPVARARALMTLTGVRYKAVQVPKLLSGYLSRRLDRVFPARYYR